MSKCNDCHGKGWVMVRLGEDDVEKDVCLTCEGKGITCDCGKPVGETSELCDGCYDTAVTQKMEDTRHPDDRPVMFRR